ncbi:MAG: hypothetical protein NTY15_09175 [Planctomycetota bacterium]|nr:hypothetical protein [Planctomycetota bacterium]
MKTVVYLVVLGIVVGCSEPPPPVQTKSAPVKKSGKNAGGMQVEEGF